MLPQGPRALAALPRRSFRPALRFALEALEPRTLLSNLWYVNSNATGAPDGLTAATGFLSIQAAINAAQPSDTILVETGDGYNESDTMGVSNLTIEADSGQSPVLDGNTPSPQSSPGFTITAGTTGVTIEGFTIQNFSGTSAIVVQNGAGLALGNDTIQDNTGSGIANFGGSVVVENATISGNSSAFGGGIFNEGALSISGSTIENNSATDQGGGLYLCCSNNGMVSATLNGDTIVDNSSPIGGGIANFATLSVTDSTIENNSATYQGGGIFVAVYPNGMASATLTGDKILCNSSTFGGGIYNRGTLTDDGSTIEKNSASQGGGIYDDNGGTITLAGTMIEQNTATAAYCYGGGGIFNVGTLTDKCSTIEDNSATGQNAYGGGIVN